ncbi:hypothetical protein F0U44_13800 [Nocardioides humilatus]|uniref:Fibronectin type-III domain-containing protein n=1 Tax=Nocardioides humilatus TaxID=2607660 RepID=A0A5B1LGZ2_9ACTN|nr:fibronectin type III domain-containing protein [Nocardioides humilatus]KAA1419498.1 hypothetical protein F0U44_13800 [Nocardioides humilatus]
MDRAVRTALCILMAAATWTVGVAPARATVYQVAFNAQVGFDDLTLTNRMVNGTSDIVVLVSGPRAVSFLSLGGADLINAGHYCTEVGSIFSGGGSNEVRCEWPESVAVTSLDYVSSPTYTGGRSLYVAPLHGLGITSVSIEAGFTEVRIDGAEAELNVVADRFIYNTDEDLTISLDGENDDGPIADAHSNINALEVWTGSGDDVLSAYGRTGARLHGGEGDDTLSGWTGANVLDGGDGVDTVTYADSAGAVTVDLDGVADDGEAGEGDAVVDVENIVGGPGDDVLSGDSSANTLLGGSGDDFLIGGDGDDVLDGEAGANRLDGGPGLDTCRHATVAKAGCELPMVPTPPVDVDASATSTSASVSFSPGDDGGDPVVRFQASCTSSDGGTTRSAVGATSPIRVGNLDRGRTYGCRARAQNGVGWSVWSSPSTPFVVPAVPPRPPTEVTSTPAGALNVGASAEVGFAASYDGGSAVTTYQAQCGPTGDGVTRYVSGAAAPLTIDRLDAGREHTCRVRARNAVGWSGWSAASSAFFTGVGPPKAPSVEGVSPVGTTVVVSILASHDGGSPITGYQVTCSSTDGGTSRSAAGASSPLTVTRLSVGSTYRCRARVQNALGWSLWSPFSALFLGE